MDTYPESEPAQELHSRAVPSVEAHHRSVGPDTGRNSGGRLIIKKILETDLGQLAQNLETNLGQLC